MKDKTAEKVIDINEDDNREIAYSEEGKKEKVQYIQLVLYGIAGFLFSFFSSFGEMSPFGISFLCAVPYDVSFVVFLFGSIGYFFSKGLSTALKYTVAMAVVCAFKLIVHKRFSSNGKRDFLSFVAFVISFGVGAVELFVTGFELYTFFLCILQGVLSFCATMFFIKSYKIPLGRIGISNLGAKEGTCLFLSGAVFLMCASYFTLEGISLGRVLAIAIILFVSLYKGSAPGAVFGIVFALSLSVDENFRYIFPCIAVSSLVSGVFSSYGQIITSVSFFVSYVISLLFFRADADIVINIIEAVLACGSFMLVPSKWITALQDLCEKTGIVKNKKINTALSESLFDSANNIYEIAGIIGNISEKLDSVINPEVDKLFSFLQQRVCTDCENKARCWNKNFNSTANDVMVIAGIKEKIKDRLPLQKRCPRIGILTSAIETAHIDYVNDMAVKMKLSEMRKVLVDQFSSMGDFLFESANKIASSRMVDTARSASMRTALTDAGVYVDALDYFTNADGRVTVEMSVIDRSFETDYKKAKTVIEVLTKRFFEKPQIAVNEIKTTVSFEERASLEVQFGYYQKPMLKDTLCGDCVSIVKGQDGTRNAIISDGMGTGSRAAIDSTMTCSILSKLLSSGFSFDSALKIVNSAMIMKSTDESLATIDGVSINVYTGKAVFYKAGAAISFVRRKDEIEVVERQSLPVGIIRNISFSKMRAELLPGDIILMVSDGAVANDCSWINDELLAWSTNNMEDLAKHIVSLASLRSDKNSRDDITALAIKITRKKIRS